MVNRLLTASIVIISHFCNTTDHFNSSIIECNQYTGIEIFGQTKMLTQHLIAAKKSPETYAKVFTFFGPVHIDNNSLPIYSIIKKYTLDDFEKIELDKYFIQKVKTDKYKIFVTKDIVFINQYYSNKFYGLLKKK